MLLGLQMLIVHVNAYRIFKILVYQQNYLRICLHLEYLF